MTERVVAICMDGVGHIHCLLPVIEGLQQRGCTVTVMTKPEFAPVVGDVGAEFVDLYDGCPLDGADAESVPVPSRFVTFDNFYADAEVSADGWSWTTGAYANGYIQRNWPVDYNEMAGGENPTANVTLTDIRLRPTNTTAGGRLAMGQGGIRAKLTG